MARALRSASHVDVNVASARSPSVDRAMVLHSNTTTCLTPTPSRSRSKPSLMSSSFRRWVSNWSTGRRPALKRAMIARHVALGDRRADVGAFQRPLLGDQRERREAHALVGMGQACGHGRSAARGRRIGELQRRNRPGHVEGDVDPAAGDALDFDGGVVRAGVDRVGRAEFGGDRRACRPTRSTATICRAPASFAPRTTLNPTPPRPTTATDWPGSTFAVLTTAPTPVSTAQPNRAASSSGRSGSIFTQDSRATTA